MKKIVLVINGNGGIGKDSLLIFAQKYIALRNISSVTPIKEIAAVGGYDDNKKDEKSRQLISDLKKLFIAYNDLPLNYVRKEYSKFLKSTKDEFLCVHIREPKEIDRLKKYINCKTLFIVRDGSKKWNNESDDNASKYKYDYTFENNKPLAEGGKDFVELLKTIAKAEK